MTEQEPGTEAIECVEVVYRALKSSWMRDGLLAPEAFIRKIQNSKAEDAVSMSRRKYATALECRTKLSRMRGTASLHAGMVRSLPFGFDLLPDPVRETSGVIVDSGHCLLVNLPDPVDDSEAAEYAASQLIKIARVVTDAQEHEEQLTRRSG